MATRSTQSWDNYWYLQEVEGDITAQKNRVPDNKEKNRILLFNTIAKQFGTWSFMATRSTQSWENNWYLQDAEGDISAQKNWVPDYKHDWKLHKFWKTFLFLLHFVFILPQITQKTSTQSWKKYLIPTGSRKRCFCTKNWVPVCKHDWKLHKFCKTFWFLLHFVFILPQITQKT